MGRKLQEENIVILTAGINPITELARKKSKREIRPVSQKQACFDLLTRGVYNKIVNLDRKKLEDISILEAIDKYVRKEARLDLFKGFREGIISLRVDKDDAQLKKYCSSIISDYLKSDPRYKQSQKLVFKLYGSGNEADKSILRGPGIVCKN